MTCVERLQVALSADPHCSERGRGRRCKQQVHVAINQHECMDRHVLLMASLAQHSTVVSAVFIVEKIAARLTPRRVTCNGRWPGRGGHDGTRLASAVAGTECAYTPDKQGSAIKLMRLQE